MPVKDVKKVVLAYSGGLDTSVILRWLQVTYRCEVVTFTADLGQGEELGPARQKAEMLGVKEIFVDDLRETFVRDFVFPMFRANALYEGQYLLGTSIARPLIAQRQIEIAEQVGADAVAHGATGKGNDQVRFELSYYSLKPDIKIIAPWREWELTSRTRLLEFAEQNQIPIARDKRGEAPFSVDANLLHSSSEGKILEDPAIEADEIVYQRTIRPEDAPDKATVIAVDFERGDAVGIDGARLSPAALLTRLNELGRDNGIGRLDMVENRFVGMKSRGVYETPGGTILLAAHRGIESITLDREAAHLKDSLMPRYAELIYNGFWFSPERRMLQALIDESQKSVNGQVRLKLYKGNVSVIGRASPNSLYSQDVVTFEEDQGRLRPVRRPGLHQAERASPASGGDGGTEGRQPVTSAVAAEFLVRSWQRRSTLRRRDLIAATLAAAIAPAARAAPKTVVLELFTSQGCSSCPPADALLGQLARRSDVIALAWHVDYWNNLGWRDRFATSTATARQKAYARQLGSQVFTPALVVDGSNVVVGSNRVSAEAAIDSALPLPVAVTLNRSEDALSVEISAHPWTGQGAAHRVRPGAGHRRRRRRERRPAPARLPHRAGGRDSGRLGRQCATDNRTAGRARSGTGDPRAVGRLADRWRGGPAARLIRAARP